MTYKPSAAHKTASIYKPPKTPVAIWRKVVWIVVISTTAIVSIFGVDWLFLAYVTSENPGWGFVPLKLPHVVITVATLACWEGYNQIVRNRPTLIRELPMALAFCAIGFVVMIWLFDRIIGLKLSDYYAELFGPMVHDATLFLVSFFLLLLNLIWGSLLSFWLVRLGWRFKMLN